MEPQIEHLSKIKSILDKYGYFYLNKKHDYETFLVLCGLFGKRRALTDIQLKNKSKAYLSNAACIPLHFDPPAVKYIGWHCVQQDEHNGASCLSDSRLVIDLLSTAEKELLSTVPVKYYQLDKKKFLYTTMLNCQANGNQVYMAPWLIPSWISPQQKSLVAKVRKLLQENQFLIHLKPGESLFIDNQRVSHGRQAIEKDSNRLLKRVWIST